MDQELLSGHRNNFGLLRLVFAALVILGHAPEMIDGDRHREPLTVIFHTVSLGELSVDAFFLMSGYLIFASMVRTANVVEYFRRRVLRIYPAFIVATLVSIFVFGPSVGANPAEHLAGAVARMLALREPRNYSNALKGLPQAALNGSLWTIYHEFRSYLIVAGLWMVGFFRQKYLILGLTAALALASFVCTFSPIEAPLYRISNHGFIGLVAGQGGLPAALRLTTLFMFGVSARVWGDWLIPKITWHVALLNLAIFVFLLFDPHAAEMGAAMFGGTSLLWLALKARLGCLQRINDRWDISYGVYLYGWPIAAGLIYFHRGLGPITVALLTLPLAMLAGTASWSLLEKWTKAPSTSRDV